MSSISSFLLLRYGASINRFAKGEYIFHEHWPAHFYFQVEEGSVKMFNSGENNDYIQGLFTYGESFGEPPLVADFSYPADAKAITNCKIWVLKKADYLKLLRENPDIHFEFTIMLAQRLCHKTKLLNTMTTQNPEKRILTVIDFFKNKTPRATASYEVPFTRQAIADMTGLRVETVIKKVLLLAQAGELEVQDHKILRH
ncbi:Crp/Fnr family transcriptional regulator [Runella slithyformis]|nr:Crp/Fnr family transcriptional regulator [Runella slithyformis]